MRANRRILVVVIALVAGLVVVQTSPDQLPASADTTRYRTLSRAIPTSVIAGRVTGSWIDSNTFEFTRGEQRFRYDISSRSTISLGTAVGPRAGAAAPSVEAPLIAPDGRLRARLRSGGIGLTNVETGSESAVVIAGSGDNRVTNGVPPSGYRSEFGQRDGMWWSPSGSKLAFYHVDERSVPDFAPAVEGALTAGARRFPYATPATPGPTTEIHVYDVTTRKTVVLATRETRTDLGDHVFRVRWLQDGSEILLLRANRRQSILDLAACSPLTGACRSLVRESSPDGWVDPPADVVFLNDGRRFIWLSDRSGFRNLYLYDLGGRLLTTLTSHDFDVSAIEHVTEASVFYTAWDGGAPLRRQLYRVTLDGRDHVRLTDPALHHDVSVAPDGRHFIDVAETHDRPPVSAVRDAAGVVVSELVRSETSAFERLGLRHVEAFTFMAADKRTPLHGVLHFPSGFDSRRRYPLLVQAWPGPAIPAAADAFTLPNRITELGFLVATLDARGGPGRGTRFAHAIYRRLGGVDVDDQVAGVRALLLRNYIDRDRVGIYGTSYAGYAATVAALRYPEIFSAAAASAPVSDWRSYSAAYTERYMGLLSDNPAAYASAVVDAGARSSSRTRVRRRLLFYYGTDDDNVHPSHTLRLVESFRRAGIPVDLQVGRGVGHAPVDEETMMGFFIDALKR